MKRNKKKKENYHLRIRVANTFTEAFSIFTAIIGFHIHFQLHTLFAPKFRYNCGLLLLWVVSIEMARLQEFEWNKITNR